MTNAGTATYLLGAQGAARDRVVAWIGIVGTPSTDLQLRVDNEQRAIPDVWVTFESPSQTLRAQRVVIDGLGAGREYPLGLIAGGEVVASARGSTLPAALPCPPDRPLTVLFGSCFSVAQDPAGLVGANVGRLPVYARPQVTILAGDQVYLDSPFLHFLHCTHDKNQLANELLGSYLATWGQGGTTGGFQRLLEEAQLICVSDDHDFWNNSPFAVPYARDTWTAAGRATWRDLATRLFRVFQSTEDGQVFTVGTVSFFVADTRIARTEDRSTFMTSDQLGAVSAWVQGLKGPGVFVTGQPIFAGLAGWKGKFTDFGLPDYRQYADLVRILIATPHDLVLLTGDVHFGRVATCDLPSGRRLVEVISSPFALVHPSAAGKWGPAPSLFPAVPVPGVAQAHVTTAAYRRVDEHFVTAGFTGAGAAVQLSVTAWPIRSGSGPWEEPVVSTVLH